MTWIKYRRELYHIAFIVACFVSAPLCAATLAEQEQANVLALCPTPTHTATASGQWDEGATWADGLPPADGAHVLIPAGLTVLIDSELPERHKTIRVDGELEFAPTEATKLLVDTLVVALGGKLVIGSDVSPILASAEVVFIDDGPVTDARQLGRGLISLGEVRIHGEEKTSWLNTTVISPSSLTLTDVPTCWRASDRILVPGVTRTDTDEVRTLSAISGSELTLEASLSHAHVPPNGMSLPVANLTRNVTLRSEASDPLRRGHIMLMHGAHYGVAYAHFDKLGRTNKSVPISASNVRGRYALHHHRCDKSIQLDVVGCVVTDSVGWGFTNHSSNVVYRDCVTYDVLGSGFVTEAGDEVGLFSHCLAVRGIGSGKDRQTRANIGDFGHSGHGFWMQGPGVSVVESVASNHDNAAFFWFSKGFKEPDTTVIANKDSSKVPLAEVRDNLAFASETGFNFEWCSQQGARSNASGLKAFSCGHSPSLGAGITVRNSRVNFSGLHVIGIEQKTIGVDFIGAYFGIGNLVDSTISDCVQAYRSPAQETIVVRNVATHDNMHDFFLGTWRNGPITFDGIADDAKFLFDNDVPVQVRNNHNLERNPNVTIRGKRAYYENQREDFVPFDSGLYAGLTNAEIFATAGKRPMGPAIPAGWANKGTYYLEP